jgi:LysM repeat protein
MMKKFIFSLVILIFILVSIAPRSAIAAPWSSGKFEVMRDAYSLIAEVNALRAANSLPPYTIDPILMATAQAHAEYMASTGQVTHYGADGSRPSERARAAGYPSSGYFSENIIMGTGLSEAEAVVKWQGDTPHLNTMLGLNYADIGAGVAEVGGRYFYVIDVGRKSSSTAPIYTPNPNVTPVFYGSLASTIVPNTPQPNGAIVHKVKPGETLWLIAITYNTKIDSIRALNNLSQSSSIYPGQELVIQTAATPLPVTPTEMAPTGTPLLTATPYVSSTPTLSPTPEATQRVSAGGFSGSSVWIVLIIAVAALILAAVITIVSAQKPR